MLTGLTMLKNRLPRRLLPINNITTKYIDKKIMAPCINLYQGAIIFD